jgi:hypothetical protein
MRTFIKLLLVILALGWMADHAEAQRRGGGRRGGGMRGGGGFGGGGGFRSAGLGGGVARAGSRPSINARPSQLPSRHVDFGAAGRPDIGAPGRPDVGQPGRPDYGRPNYDRDYGIVDRDIYVDRDFDVGDDWWDYDDRWDGCCYYPVARAAAWGAAATAATYGSSAYALPSDCVSTVVNGITYYQCGSAWYQPQFQGTTVTYVAVSPPR